MAAKRKRKTTARSKTRWLAANRRWLPYAGIAVAVIVAGGVGYLLGHQGGGTVAPRPGGTTIAVAPLKPPIPNAAPGRPASASPVPLPTAAPGQPAGVPPAMVPPLPNAAPGETAPVVQPAAPPPMPVQAPPAPEGASYANQDRRRLADLARATQDEPRRPRELASLPPPVAAVVPPKLPPQGRRPSLALASDERPMVAMVFDDLGVVKSRTKRVIDLPGPLTLSFLPYAEDLSAQTADGRRHGHEVMLHMPMQPLGKADPGRNALTVDLAPDDIRQRLTWALDRIGPVGGLNNHMGSRFTEHTAGMTVLMGVLHRRQLYFLDSMTIGSSVGVATARQAGVQVVARDVFLDDKITRENAARWLASLEGIAKRQGYGIAIGHPHDETVDVVGPWLRTLDGKGLRLVKLEELVRRLNPPAENTPVSASMRAPG